MTKNQSADELDALRARYATASLDMKRLAQQREAVLLAVEKLVSQGHKRTDARAAVSAQLKRDRVRRCSVASISRWEASVRGYVRADWPAALLPRYRGSLPRIPALTRTLIIASVLAGDSMCEVAAKQGVHAKTVARIARAAGLGRASPAPEA